jgi:uncharacterized iron-regulated membrane protein
MRPAVRRGFLQVHLWLGLTLGALLLMVAVTGAILAWRPPLEQRLDPHLFIVPAEGAQLPADELVQRARAAHPGFEVESLRYFGDPTAAFQVYFSDHNYLHLNPYSGAVLGLRSRYGRGFGWVEGLHKFLQMDPSAGETIMGTNALIFGVIIFTGLILAWPATGRALRALLRFNRRLSGRPWQLNLHKTVGLYAALVLLASIATGLPQSFDWAKNLLYPLTGSQRIDPPRVPHPTPAFAGYTIMAAQLDQAVPQGAEHYIGAPKNGVVPTYAVGANATHPNARSYLWLDSATGAVLKSSPYAAAGTGFRLYFWMLSFHTGEVGGWPVRLVLFCGALALSVLICTGAYSFLLRKSGSARRQTRANSDRSAA